MRAGKRGWSVEEKENVHFFLLLLLRCLLVFSLSSLTLSAFYIYLDDVQHRHEVREPQVNIEIQWLFMIDSWDTKTICSTLCFVAVTTLKNNRIKADSVSLSYWIRSNHRSIIGQKRKNERIINWKKMLMKKTNQVRNNDYIMNEALLIRVF